MNKRREFIKITGLATAGIMLYPSCSPKPGSGGTADNEVTEVPKRDVGLQIYTVREQLANDLEGTLKAVADIGFTQVEIFGYNDGTYFGKPASEFYALLKQYGLSPISSHHLTGLVNTDAVGTLTNGWEKAVEDAATAGQKYMACAWLFPQERTLESYKALPELLNKAGEIVRSAGMQFCYHNHDFEFETIDGLVPMYHLLDNTDPANLAMELDLYWISKAGYDPIEFFSKYPGRVPLMHFKDMADSEEREFTEVGNGTIDFQAILAQKELSGLTHFFVEQDVSPDPLQSIATSYNNIAKW